MKCQYLLKKADYFAELRDIESKYFTTSDYNLRVINVSQVPRAIVYEQYTRYKDNIKIVS